MRIEKKTNFYKLKPFHHTIQVGTQSKQRAPYQRKNTTIDGKKKNLNCNEIWNM